MNKLMRELVENKLMRELVEQAHAMNKLMRELVERCLTALSEIYKTRAAALRH